MKLLTFIFTVAVIVSIVHYTDNYFNYHDYPRSRTLPNPSPALIGASWFAFTAVGLAGYVLFRQRPTTLALALLALYSGSGLVGIGHYLVPGATGMPWWRQLHVCLDILCGMAMFAFVLRASALVRARPLRP